MSRIARFGLSSFLFILKLKNMKTKILKYGAYPRHNQVVTAHADVTFLNEYVGYSEGEKCEYNPDYDTFHIILRVKSVSFNAKTICRKDMENEMLLPVMTERAKNLQSHVEGLMSAGKFVNLIYIAVFAALGWDARTLREYREEYIRRQEEERRREQAALNLQRKADEHKREEEWNMRLDAGQKLFDMGECIDVECFIGLCERAGIGIHPRTKGTLNKSITDVSKTKIKYIPKRNCRAPGTGGCFKLVEHLISYYDASKSPSNT